MAETPIVRYSKAGRITVGTISAASVLDAANVSEFGSAVLEYIKVHPGLNLLLDFRNVRYLSSAVLTELLRIKKEIEEKGGKLKLCGLNENIAEVFEITNLDQVFVIYPDTINGVKRFERSLDVEAQDDSWEHLGPGKG